MQAFRHLYVLAVEPRSIEAIDVDSKASVYVPVSITLESQNQVCSLLCLPLFDCNQVLSISVCYTFCDAALCCWQPSSKHQHEALYTPKTCVYAAVISILLQN